MHSVVAEGKLIQSVALGLRLANSDATQPSRAAF